LQKQRKILLYKAEQFTQPHQNPCITISSHCRYLSQNPTNKSTNIGFIIAQFETILNAKKKEYPEEDYLLININLIHLDWTNERKRGGGSAMEASI